MLQDPLAIDARSPVPALNLSVIRQDGYGSERRDSGGVYSLVINHSTGKNGERHYLQVRKVKDAENPYSGVTSPQTASVSFSFSKPPVGFTNTEMVELLLLAWDIVAEATAVKILNFES